MASVWTGIISDDFNDPANWVPSVAAPGVGDDILYNHSAVQGCNTNLTRDVMFGTITATGLYRFNVGSATNPLKCGATTVRWQGQGTFGLTASGVGVTINRVIVDSVYYYNPITLATNGVQMKVIEWINGTGEINNAFNIDSLYVGYNERPDTDSQVFCSATGGIDLMAMNSGRLILRQPAGTGSNKFYVGGGSLIVAPAASGTYVDTLWLGGGRLAFSPIAANATITTMNGMRGVMQANDSASNSVLTVTTLRQWPGLNILDDGETIVIGTRKRIGVP